MSVQNIGSVVKDFREGTHMSQADFCFGLCSTQSLSNIEKGRQTISPSLFESFAQRVGKLHKPYPEFPGIEDFKCYMLLYRARFFVWSWQLDEAEETLEEIEKMNFASNKLYYQKWLMYHALILELSGNNNLKKRENLIIQALNITSAFENRNNKKSKLLESELILFTMLGNIYIANGKSEKCKEILKDISNRGEWVIGRSRENNIIKSFIQLMNYTYLLVYDIDSLDEENVRKSYVDAVNTHISVPIVRMSYIYACTLYMKGKKSEGEKWFDFFEAGSLLYRTGWSKSALMFLRNNKALSKIVVKLASKQSCKKYQFPKEHDISLIEAGDTNKIDTKAIHIGDIIKYLRVQQKLSRGELAKGICEPSWLLKIEDKGSKPSIILANVLLQRLGIVDQIFEFFGTSEEELFYKYRNILVLDYDKHPSIEYLLTLEKIKKLKISEGILEKQFISLIEAIIEPDMSKRKGMLINAIKITRHEFEVDKLPKVMSYTEFNILQQIYRCEYSENPLEEVEHLKRFMNLNYPIEQYRAYIPVLYNTLEAHLYLQKKYSELEELNDIYESALLRYYMDFQIYFFSTLQKAELIVAFICSMNWQMLILYVGV